jgi:lipid A 3-O-deacylase
MKPFIATGAVALAFAASPASAQEVFGGVHAHDVDTPLNKGGFEGGLAVQAGVRGGRISRLKAIGAPSPYAFASVSTEGATNFAAVGLSWKIGGRVFLRPGIGLAVHDRSSHVVHGNLRADFGSRILFEPEIGLGFRIDERWSAEASWVHMSHAGLFNSRQNPGIDNIGVRLNYRFR